MVALSRGREVAWRLACFWSCIDVNMDRVKVSNHRNCAILPWGSTPLNQKIQQYFTYFVFRALHPREQTNFSTRGSGRDSVKYLPTRVLFLVTFFSVFKTFQLSNSIIRDSALKFAL
jgi:hypothetical protein